jgi:hypothetical protein
MRSTELRQLIRESINEYIREIDDAGNTAALEAKMNKTQEAIELREKKTKMEGLDEAYHDMLDKGKMKELSSEIKALKKSLAKYEKQLDKLKNKGTKTEKSESEEKEEIIDETFPESGSQLEENINSPIEKLSKYVNEPDLYKNDFNAWEDALFSGELEDDYGFNYFVRNWTVLDDEQSRHEDEIGKDVDYFKTTYHVNDEAANLMKQLVDTLDENMNIYEVLHMQKLAGIISETEYVTKVEEVKKKASAGLTKKEKSTIAKKAHAGKDIGKKEKGFEKVAKAGEKQYGSEEAGKRVAAAAMWKGEAKKAKSLKEEVQSLFENEKKK